MPRENCCHNYEYYILFARVAILTMIPITLIILNLIPMKVPKPSGRTTCSEQYHGAHSHSVPGKKCKIENSFIMMEAGETCKIVMMGSRASLDLKSKEPFSVGYCEDGEYAYRYGKSHKKDVSLTLGACEPTEFIFEISSDRSNKIKVSTSVATRGIFSPFCSLLDFFILVAVMIFYCCSVCISLSLSGNSSFERSDTDDGSCPYNTLLCFTGFFCLDQVFDRWAKNLTFRDSLMLTPSSRSSQDLTFRDSLTLTQETSDPYRIREDSCSEIELSTVPLGPTSVDA